MTVWKNKHGRWIAKFTHMGRQYKHQAKTRKAAIDWEVTKRHELGAKPRSQTHIIYFHEMATAYLDHCRPRMQHNTVRQKAHVYRNFIEYIGGDRPIGEIATKIVSDYLNNVATHGGSKTANRHRRDLHACFSWAIQNDFIHMKNPVTPIKKFPEEPVVKYIPPVKDVAKVRLSAQGDQRDFIECIYHMAARRGEILRLTWQDINFQHRWVRLYTRKRRGGELQADYLPMNDTLFSILWRRWKHRDHDDETLFKFSISELRRMMPQLCKRAGVKPFGFHSIRHHVASILNDSGKASMKQIQTILRHRRQATTETYLHNIGQNLQDVVGLLDQSGTPGTLSDQKETGSKSP